MLLANAVLGTAGVSWLVDPADLSILPDSFFRALIVPCLTYFAGWGSSVGRSPPQNP
jgi:hypothetical protein